MNQVNRGGSWYDVADDCPSAYRDYDSRDFHYDSMSFRIAIHRDRYRILRGGSIWNHRALTRCAYRDRIWSAYMSTEHGFRVSRRKR